MTDVKEEFKFLTLEEIDEISESRYQLHKDILDYFSSFEGILIPYSGVSAATLSRDLKCPEEFYEKLCEELDLLSKHGYLDKYRIDSAITPYYIFKKHIDIDYFYLYDIHPLGLMASKKLVKNVGKALYAGFYAAVSFLIYKIIGLFL